MLGRSIVMLIASDVTSQKCARVDENHDASPYR